MNAELNRLNVEMKFVEKKSMKRITHKEREKSVSPVAGSVSDGFFIETIIEMFKHVLIPQPSKTSTKARSRGGFQHLFQSQLSFANSLPDMD